MNVNDVCCFDICEIIKKSFMKNDLICFFYFSLGIGGWFLYIYI